VISPPFATKLIAMATSLKILEKEYRIDQLQFNTYHMCKDCENRSSGSRDTLAPSDKSGEQVRYDTRLVAIATSIEESEKLDLIKKIHANTFHLVKKL